MSASGGVWTLVVSGIASAVSLVPPSQLLVEDIPGFELTSGPATDIGFAEYAEREPDAVAHIEPDSEAASELVAAIEVWTHEAAGEVIHVEVVRVTDEKAATALVDQAAANSIALGLGATDPPFGGAWSYSGGLDDSWTNVVAWNQGPYAVTITQLSTSETARGTIDTAAVRQAEAILHRTGAEVSEDGVVAGDAPTPPTQSPAAEELDTGGFPVGTVLVVLSVTGVAAFVLAQQRRKYPGSR